MQIDTAGIAYAFATVVSVCLAAITWRRRSHDPVVASALALVMVGAAWWSGADAVKAIAANETAASVASLLIFPGLGTAIAAFVCLGLALARPQWVPPRRLLLALLVEPLLISLAAATNPWHHLVYAGPGALAMTRRYDWTFGSIFWLHTWYSYLALATGMALIAWSYWSAPRAFRAQRALLFLASLAPVLVNVVRLAGGFGEIPDPTPLGFAVTGSIMAYAIFRQDLFTFAPVARAMIIDQIGDAIVVVSPMGRVLDLNPAAVALVRRLNPGAPAHLVGAIGSDLLGQHVTAAEMDSGIVVELPGGGRGDFHVRTSRLMDSRRRDLGTVYVARDVTEANAQSRRLSQANGQLVQQVATIERLRADLVELASRDPLTGLHNRRFLVEQFGPMLTAASRSGDPVAVALIDVDRFKSINDHYGHLVGDEVLVALAHRIRAQAPAGAIVARWGGEEFFIAVPGADAAEGFAIAEGVRHRCERDGIDVTGSTMHTTVSIGVATYPGSGRTMNELLHAADVALYEAKDAGRNTVRPDPNAAGVRAPDRRTDRRTDQAIAQ